MNELLDCCGNLVLLTKMKEALEVLKWDIEIYQNLLVIYKDKKYLPSHFQNIINLDKKRYNNIWMNLNAHRIITQNDENTITWD